MIKRTLLVIAVIVAVVFVPYFLGMFNIPERFAISGYAEAPYYIKGVLNLLIIFFIVGVFAIISSLASMVYDYIKNG